MDVGSRKKFHRQRDLTSINAAIVFFHTFCTSRSRQQRSVLTLIPFGHNPRERHRKLKVMGVTGMFDSSSPVVEYGLLFTWNTVRWN